MPNSSENTLDDKDYLLQAIRIAGANVARGGQPFGAILVRHGEILAEGVNETYLEHDPTAHAEIQALRNASRLQQSSNHPGTTMYASGIPCAMCMAAMIAAGVDRVVYCADDAEGGPYGWATAHLYERMQRPFGEQGIAVQHLPLPEKRAVFEAWQSRHGYGPNDSLQSPG
ncbi:MAG TPA: nucleoside deaminase [Salinisphaeraceae bacterium]|nr:nucleoside deaminase [Salinisphaeraceae bacterium]